MKLWERKLACITKMPTSTNYIKSLGIFKNIFFVVKHAEEFIWKEFRK